MGEFFRNAIFCLAVILGALVIKPTSAKASQCDLALVLAIDASSSVDEIEYKLQQNGLAAALLDLEVQEAIIALGGMQLTAFEWSGRYHQEEMVGWRSLRTSADISSFALQLANHKRVYAEFPTAIGYALGHASGLLRVAPETCTRNVVDVAGDGTNNEGFGPKLAYHNFDFENVTVNGLVIKGADPDPEPYYRNEVLFGVGSFLVIADDFDDYARAIKKKLLMEIGNRNLSNLER